MRGEAGIWVRVDWWNAFGGIWERAVCGLWMDMAQRKGRDTYRLRKLWEAKVVLRRPFVVGLSGWMMAVVGLDFWRLPLGRIEGLRYDKFPVVSLDIF